MVDGIWWIGVGAVVGAWVGCAQARDPADAGLVDADASPDVAGTLPSGSHGAWQVPPAHAVPAGAPGPSNVLVVVIDDVGIDLVDAYGVGGDPAYLPTVDGLAAEGVVFENAYATPLCSSTRAALMTGRYGRRTGVGHVITPDQAAFTLPLAEVTIPEMLRAAPEAWATAAVGKWHLVNEAYVGWEVNPLDQGFDHFAGTLENLGHDHHRTSYFDWFKDTDGVVARTTTYATTDSANEAVARIAEMPEPWFLYLAFNAPHLPLHVPPAELVPEQPSADAGAEVLVRAAATAVDTELGRVLASMSPELRQRTTVVFVGDNGTSGAAVVPPLDPSDSKGTLTDGGIHVPLIVTGPAVAIPGSRSAALVHVVDLLPTVAELAGVDVSTVAGPEGAGLVLDGLSLVPYLADPALPSARSVLYDERFSPNGPPPHTKVDWASVRDERYALVVARRGPELYDLASGPGTTPDLLDGDVDPALAAIADDLLDQLVTIQGSLTYAHPAP